MIYTLKKYSETFKINGKKVSKYTVKRRLLKGQLPSGHIHVRGSGKTGEHLIEVIETNKLVKA
ncbi:MAG: hypothetical protein IMZ64_01745 [Bacteroidetes bacterium]|nr:hypothetical protein [Bacteroidota bacterium]